MTKKQRSTTPVPVNTENAKIRSAIFKVRSLQGIDFCIMAIIPVTAIAGKYTIAR